MSGTGQAAAEIASGLGSDADCLWRKSARELAGLIAAGEVSAREAADAHIDRIHAVNPKLNAVVVSRFDAARCEADAVDQKRAAGQTLPPLAGVPVTIKECIDVEGTPSTFGLPSRAAVIADADDRHVARLRSAGAVILGKTNDSQLLLCIESDNPLYGRTNNPWNVERICGGSSGGEGAIIAAGGSALGLGTDIGGSVRYPASFCGISGFKPTAGRCPDFGRFSVHLGQEAIRSQVGVLARNVGDVIAGLAAIDGGGRPELGSGGILNDPASVDLRRLRIGFYCEDGILSTSPAVRRAVTEAADALRHAGAELLPWAPPEIPDAFHLFFKVLSADRGASLKKILKNNPVHPSVKMLLMLGSRSSGQLAVMRRLLQAAGQSTLAAMTRHFGYNSVTDYWNTLEELSDYRARFATAMRQTSEGPIDVVLGPVCALPALRHGATKDLGIVSAHTLLYNVLGWPAGVVPVTTVAGAEESERKPSRDIVQSAAAKTDRGSAGLPIGVQLAAPPWNDHVVLAAMQGLERQIGWDKQPDI